MAPFFLQRKKGAGLGRVFAFASIANQPHTFENRYVPGSGVGASSIANRRANLRRATKTEFACALNLGLYSHNPNGFIPCFALQSTTNNAVANLNHDGMTQILGNNTDDYSDYLNFTGMDFFFFGTNYGNSTDKIYMCTNYAFGFGDKYTNYQNWSVENPAILFSFLDAWNFESYASPVVTTPSGLTYLRIVAIGTDNRNYQDPTVRRSFEIFFARDATYQYMQFNCAVENFDKSVYASNTTDLIANGSNITDGVNFKGTFGAFSGPVAGKSYVIRSNLNGNEWQFLPETHIVF